MISTCNPTVSFFKYFSEKVLLVALCSIGIVLHKPIITILFILTEQTNDLKKFVAMTFEVEVKIKRVV